jgi:predicted nuclease of restriction endonuclease-like (RecB) superfamily
MNSNDPRSYSELLGELESAVGSAQSSLVRAVNRAVIQLYWDIGRSIVQREEFESWEGGLVDSISRDLHVRHPGSLAFSVENVKLMRQFFLAYTRDYGQTAEGREMDGVNLPEVLTGLPWCHNLLLIEIVQDPAERLWYAQTAAQLGWSLTALEHEIRQGRYRQSGKTAAPAPVPLPDLTREMMTDPLTAEFLRLTFS